MVRLRYQSLFALSLSLSRLRRDAHIPEYNSREVVTWLDSAEPSMVLRVMLDVVMDARLSGRLPENRWVELVSHMILHPFLLLASAVALTCRPQFIMAMQYFARLNGTLTTRDFNLVKARYAEMRAFPPKMWREISSVSKECTRESFWDLEDTHQEELGAEKECLELWLSNPSLPLQEGVGNAQTSDHEEAAADQEQVSPSRGFTLLCDALLSEKVIKPMVLADRERSQKIVGERVVESNWGMILADSRVQHFFEREKFVAELLPPQMLRIIDCQQSVEKGVVVLIDRLEDIAYTAISHTYGGDVYKVYDCGCATTYMGEGKARANPAETPCKGHQGPDKEKQTRVMKDMLNMCRILVEKGGVHYAWHDGICVAQYDEEDVTDSIMHMGWIYANAKDTVIFLHYAGQPMAPIGTGSDPVPLVARWHTRAWTFQEAVLSKHRRYCVLRGDSRGSCVDWQEFEDRLAVWYAPGQSTIEIIDEADFFHSILLLQTQIEELRKKGEPSNNVNTITDLRNIIIRDLKVMAWKGGLGSLLGLLHGGLFFFVTMAHALKASSTRDSKHPGDHINCILALAGVEKFSVPKDEDVEQWAVQFFKQMGKKGLEFAVFTSNESAPPSLEECSMHRLTWLPSLCGRLSLSLPHFQDGGANFNTSQIEFEVLEKNSHIQLTGPLVCVPVRFYWKKRELQIGEMAAAPSAVKDIFKQDNRPISLSIFSLKNCNKEEEERETADSRWIPASVSEEISEVAEFLTPDDNLGIFLREHTKKPGSWIASDLRAGGDMFGEALFPAVIIPYWAAKDEKTLMELSASLADNLVRSVLGIFMCMESDTTDVLIRDANTLTVKTMDWREAWAYYYLSKKFPDPSWNEAVRKFFFRCTEIREALTQCGKLDRSGLMLCLQEFYAFPTVNTFVQADLLQRCKMGSFRASLVFPAEVLSRDSADFDTFGFPTLIISNDCNDSPVTKVGCLNGTDALHSLLVRKHFNFKHLTKLEIC